ncbi:MAG TPA: VOC family protein [Terracidiphilus sp.]|jgi:PhnB protein|nr:VOC family protein [Terracidiphilus sp.]
MGEAVLHASITIDNTVLMASDVPPERFQPMRSVYLSLSVDTDAEAERIYKLRSDGGEVFMPMAEQFFASRFVQLRDKFGVSWMILHEKPMGSPQP